uniref:Fasciculation and elongation protein zeta 1 n=1 Tax=Malurus cyaneus samueli TaxID=2593467 RepID=A0A8C5THV6_9PASS
MTALGGSLVAPGIPLFSPCMAPSPEEAVEMLQRLEHLCSRARLGELGVLTWRGEGSRESSFQGALGSRALSAELVAQLARRDELAFEKEVKTAFIGALLAVQGEQREQREAARRRRRDKGLSMQGARSERGSQMPRKRFSMEGISSILHSGLRQTFGPTTNEKQYLNTVIPYEKKGSPPSVEDLQMLTNILFAMKEGNEKVPTLLTDYILKGTHCPPALPSFTQCPCSSWASPIAPSCTLLPLPLASFVHLLHPLCMLSILCASPACFVHSFHP